MSSNIIQKYAVPVITPAIGGSAAADPVNGLPSHSPARLGGFFPTAPYAALRVFINGEGNSEAYPLSYVNYRLPYAQLTQSPPLSKQEITQLVENNLRGQYNPARPYVYLQADFNVWAVGELAPYVLPSAEVYSQIIPNGWGSGAVTTDCFAGRGSFSFTVDGGAYAAVGIAGATGDPADPSSVDFGFMFREYLPVTAIERGVEFALSSTTYALPANAFSVRFVDGVVNYYVNGTSLRQVTAAPAESTVAYHGIAALYGANSRITGGAVVGYSRAAVSIPALRMFRKAAILTLPALRGTAGWKTFAYGTLPRLGFVGGSAPYAWAKTQLPRMSTAASGRTPQDIRLPRLSLVAGRYSAGAVRLPGMRAMAGLPTYATAALRTPVPQARGYAGRIVPLGGMVSMPRVRAIATGSTSSGGGGTLTLPKMILRSARFASVSATLPKAVVFGYQDPAGEAFVSGAPFGATDSTTAILFLVNLDMAGNITSTAAVLTVRDAALYGSAQIIDAQTTTAIISALMNSSMIGASFQPLSEQGGETWVVNSDTSASSSYENYSFNSFSAFNGQMYGARSDGLYLMEGATDAGAAIHSGLSFGATDFNTQQLKRLEYAYVGLSSAGTMYLKVKVQGGTEYVYAARRSDDFMALQRIDVGRGLRATYMTFELYNSDGCDFELNTVSFRAAELTRSI
jgi:hypothetical protein